jgi:hypothetical protein
MRGGGIICELIPICKLPRLEPHHAQRNDGDFAMPNQRKGIGLTIVLLLDDFFRNFPRIEDDATSKAFEQVVPDILDKLDIVKGLVPPN